MSFSSERVCGREIARIERDDYNVPVHQNSAAGIQTVLDERIGRLKTLQQIFVFDIVYFDYHVLVTLEELLVKR